MLNRKWILLASVLAIPSGFSFAQGRGETTMVQGPMKSEEGLRDQKWGLTPQLGMVGYTRNSGATTSRIAIGVAFDWNAESTLRPEAPKDQYIGLSTGFLYSHPGATDANFLGSSSSTGSDANLVLIPIDLKLGYQINDSVRFAVRGGGNLIYRSNAGVSDLGAGSTGSASLWKIYPNVGVDADIELSKNLLLTIRPDITLTPANDLYVATIGATYVGF